MDNSTHFLNFAICFQKASGEKALSDFKRRTLPRVKKPLGIIKGLYPQSLLDIGYGRGAFLFPLMEQNPHLSVTVIDNDPFKIDILEKVKNGGISRLFPMLGDINSIPFVDNSFDVVTALEVMEHLTNPLQAAKEITRVSKKFSIISVPSKPDENPQHLSLLKQQDIEHMFNQAGAEKLSFEWVNGHMISVIQSKGVR